MGLENYPLLEVLLPRPPPFFPFFYPFLDGSDFGSPFLDGSDFDP